MASAITRTANPAAVNAASTVATYSTVDIGAAAADRIIVVAVASELASTPINSCTIDYGSGDTSMSASTAGNFGAVYARLFYLAVATGTTATIKVTFGTNSPSSTQHQIAVYRLTGAEYSSTGGDGSTDMDATDPLTTGAITIATGGGFIAVAGGAGDTGAKTWNNATGDLDADAGALRFTTATRTNALSATAVTCVGANNEDGALSYLIFTAASGDKTVTPAQIATTLALQEPTVIVPKNAIILDAAGKYGLVSNFAAIDTLSDFTMETWVKNSASSSAYAWILAFYPYDGAASTFGYLQTENATGSTGINFAIKYDGGTNADGYTTTAYLTQGTWVHVALVHDGTAKRTYIYVNGTEISYNLQQTGVGTIRPHTTADFSIGNSLGTKLIGSIGGFVRLWSDKRTATELTNNKSYNVLASGEDNLIVNLRFTESTGTTLDNEATAGADATLYGSPSWEIGPTVTEKSYGTSTTQTPDQQTTTLTLQAPTVVTERSVTVVPNQQTTTVALQAPTITAVKTVSITIDQQSATLALQAPTITVTKTATVSADQQQTTLTPQTPTVTTTKSVTVAAAQQSTTITVQAPTITAVKNATTSADQQQTTLALQAPTISLSTNAAVAPAQQTTTLTLQAPTVTAIKNVAQAPAQQTATVSLQTPTVSAIKNATIQPAQQTATITLQTPAFTAVKNATIQPAQQATTFTLQAPTVTAVKNATISADAVTLTGTLPAPTVLAGGAQTVSADQQTTTLALQAPIITAVKNVSVATGALALSAAIQAPTVTAIKNASVTADTQTLTASLQAPTITTTRNITVLSDTQSLTGTLPAPTVDISGNAVNVIVSVPTLSLGGSRAAKLILVDGNLAYNVGGIYHIGI